MHSITNSLRGAGIVVAAFVVVASGVLFVPSHASAADLFDGGGYDVYDYSPSFDGGYDIYDYSAPTDYGYDIYDYSDNSDGYDIYDYSDYSPSYTTSGYPVSGYTGSGYTASGYVGGGYVSTPSYYTAPQRTASTGGQTQTQTQHQSSVNNNTNVNNNVITINTPTQAPQPTPVCPSGTTGTYPNCVWPQPVYNTPVCSLSVSNYNTSYGYQPVTLTWSSQYATSGYINNGVGAVSLAGSITVNPQVTTTYTGTFTGQNGQTTSCSATVTRSYNPIVYTNPLPTTPYVTLSQVPYTGLDLGFWGTIAYWGFLVLFALVAAYLIAVKRVQNTIARKLGAFLFGTSDETVAAPAQGAVFSPADLKALAAMILGEISEPQVATANGASTRVSTTESDSIDPFIMSQVNRPRR